MIYGPNPWIKSWFYKIHAQGYLETSCNNFVYESIDENLTLSWIHGNQDFTKNHILRGSKKGPAIIVVYMNL